MKSNSQINGMIRLLRGDGNRHNSLPFTNSYWAVEPAIKLYFKLLICLQFPSKRHLQAARQRISCLRRLKNSALLGLQRATERAGFPLQVWSLYRSHLNQNSSLTPRRKTSWASSENLGVLEKNIQKRVFYSTDVQRKQREMAEGCSIRFLTQTPWNAVVKHHEKKFGG